MKKIFILITGCAIINFATVKSCYAQNMKVKIYKMDRENYTKGECIGFVELREGKLEIKVTDPEVREFIIQESNKEFRTFRGQQKGNIFVENEVTIKPGSVEHLRLILEECWKKYRIIAEEISE
ncbi:MAG: hypothetical protein DRP73_01585 [Candidatus Omnitrophota bacterium]|nr:MAG: hypothetical protein DRP73_01585 [Candidatus Omnitrophota bacterium]